MVITFLEKYQNEILDEKIKLENQIHELEIKGLEIETFIDMLQKEIDTKFESFTPLQVYSPNKEKIVELKFEKRVLNEELKKLNEQYQQCSNRFDEICDVMNAAERNNELQNNKNAFTNDSECSKVFKYVMDESDLNKLRLILSLIDQDSIRAKLELQNYIKQIDVSRETQDSLSDE